VNNKKSKYIIKGRDTPSNIFESHLDKIEEIGLSLNSIKKM